MPNHTTNWLAVRGPAKTLDAIEQAIREGRFLSYCYPIPAGYRDPELSRKSCLWGGDDAAAQDEARATLRAMHGSDNVTSWASLHWGTKWDIYSVEGPVRLSQTQLIARFDTAWSQPTRALTHLIHRNDGVNVLCLSEDDGGEGVALLCTSKAHESWLTEGVTQVTTDFALCMAEHLGWDEEASAMSQHFGFSVPYEDEDEEEN